MATVLFRAGKFNEAERFLARRGELVHPDDEVQCGLLCQYLIGVGRSVEAIAIAEGRVSRNADDAPGWGMLAKAYESGGLVEKAEYARSMRAAFPSRAPRANRN